MPHTIEVIMDGWQPDGTTLTVLTVPFRPDGRTKLKVYLRRYWTEPDAHSTEITNFYNDESRWPGRDRLHRQ